MSDVQRFDFFLAHAASDVAPAQRLFDLLALEARPFLAARSLTAGDNWDAVIRNAQLNSAITVVLLSKNTQDAFYQREEIALAINQSRQDGRHRVVPVYLERDVDVPYGLWIKQSIYLGQDVSIEVVAQKLLAMRPTSEDEPVAPGTARVTTVGATGRGGPLCPYKGLAAYGEGDVELFFGRERVVDLVMTRLDSSRFLALVGISGCGKTSILTAGVLPTLRTTQRDATSTPRISLMTPGADPLRAVARALRRVSDRSAIEASGVTAPVEGPLLVAVQPTFNQDRTILVVDQLEEIFTQCPDIDDRRRFLRVLVDASVNATVETIVLVSIRSDYYGRCAEEPSFADLISGTHILIGAMTDQELQLAVERPAWRMGLSVEPGVTAAVIAEASKDPGVLPLVSQALVQTWLGRHGDTLSVAAFRESGGVAGAVAASAETTYALLTTREQSALAEIMLQLVRVGTSGRDARRRRARCDILENSSDPITSAHVIQLAITARLLVTSEQDDIDLVHEAIIWSWPRLQEWVTASRRELALRDGLDEDASTWIDHGRDRAYLYRGVRLSEVTALQHLTRDATDLLTASIRARRRQRAFRAVGICAVLVFLAVAGALLGARAVERIRVESARSSARAPTAAVAVGSARLQVDLHEVSVGQYRRCVERGPCSPVDPPPTGLAVADPEPSRINERAVVWIRGTQAAQFCRWLNRDLPTGAEWVAIVESPLSTLIWTLEPDKGAASHGYLPEHVRGDQLNFGNVFEWTQSPAHVAGLTFGQDGLPSRLEFRGVSGKAISENPLLLAQPEEWTRGGRSADSTDRNLDLGFRCVSSRD